LRNTSKETTPYSPEGGEGDEVDKEEEQGAKKK
jgi:hypothetical protein